MVFVGTNDLLKNVPVNKVREFEVEYLDYLEQSMLTPLLALKTENTQTLKLAC